jgi:hypothetical protein
VPWDADVVRFGTNAVAPIRVLRVLRSDEPVELVFVVSDGEYDTLVRQHLQLAADIVGVTLLAMRESDHAAAGWEGPTSAPARPHRVER